MVVTPSEIRFQGEIVVATESVLGGEPSWTIDALFERLDAWRSQRRGDATQPSFVLQVEDGSYTREVERVLRTATAAGFAVELAAVPNAHLRSSPAACARW